MSISSIQLARVSNLLRTSVATSTISSTQKKLLQVQQELSTGKRLIAPSDDAGDAAVAQQLRKTLEKRASYSDNLGQAKLHLGEVDSTLDDLTGLVREAQQIASANVGSDVPPDSRIGASAVVKSLYSQMLTLANKQFQGTYLFAGTKQDQQPFIEEGGGVKFQGSKSTLSNDFDENTILNFMVDGDEVFGALSTRVEGSRDLSPAITASTRLAHLNGTAGRGINRGTIQVSDGTTTALVDLSNADTIGDVVDAINNAGIGTLTAAVGLDGQSLALGAGVADTISVNEVGGGTTAADLGILQPGALGAGVALAGQNVGARVTPLTNLADLAPGALPPVDLTSGFTISNGLLTATIDLTGAVTVEDLLNRVNGSGTAVKAEINAAGTGINIFNPTEGAELRIGENGGTTATDLGIRSFEPTSQLSQLNHGKGVRLTDDAGLADLRITRSDGTAFDVDLTGSVTMQDVITRINAAGGGTVTASFATTGNGLVLTDTAGGGGQVTVENLNFAHAKEDLGLTEPAVGNVITGADVHPVRAQGLFHNIAKLRDALLTGDQRGITEASEGLEKDYQRLVNLRGQTGARVQELEARTERIEEQNLATKGMLSLLEDADYTDAITRFQTLQMSLQATLQTNGRVLNLSLLDFLG
jgi:flagellar hook-associated protein 3 FlgL